MSSSGGIDAALIDEVFSGLRTHLVNHRPTVATRLGDHAGDHHLGDWSASGLDARLRSLSALRRRLDGDHDGGGGPPEGGGQGHGPAEDRRLHPDVDADRRLLADTLDRMRFELEELRLPETDPTYYLDLATGGVDELLRRDDLPAPPRHEAAAARASRVPELLEQARANLTGVAAPHLEVLRRRTPGAAALFRESLASEIPEAAEAAESAAAACEVFAAHVEERAGDPAPDWRLGERRWRQALRLSLGEAIEPGDIWAWGQQALADLDAEAEELAGRILGGEAGQRRGPELVRAALDRLAEDRCARGQLVPEAAGVLNEITAFLGGTELFDTPDPSGLRVEEMPPFQQGVAVAYLRPAPPLEPAAPHRYHLSPVPSDWDESRAESFLREYNRTTLRSVGIHEAYPGHYAHFAAAHDHPSLVRRTLANGACAEGWAVYVERQVVEAGFGGDAQRLATAKMDMRAVANALLDQGLHVHGWDDDDAMRLMTERVYQEEAEAAGKLLRGKVTAGQLSSYFVGGRRMVDIRGEAAAARGDAFSSLDFHREVLGHGVPPLGALRRLVAAG